MNWCVEYAKMCGSVRVETELLPQMLEQITHKYYERRLLVISYLRFLMYYVFPGASHNCFEHSIG